MNNKLEIEATITHVGEVEEIGAKGFKRRTIVLTEPASDDNKYPTLLALTLKKDNTSLVEPKHQGAKAKVVAYVESRSWDNPKTGKRQYFTEATAVKVKILATQDTAAETIADDSECPF
jgi:hypothetical protein